jgi:arginine/lysine/ornithine decarboxylase
MLETAYQRADAKPCALYLTSPDYLGNMSDIALAADFCRRHGMLLLVDNAHGAYLRFLPAPCHPTALGADLCCDSAHKTLPVLTGGAYLHIADSAPAVCHDAAKSAMALFASTSPSWLILQSLDRCNALLEQSFPAQIRAFLPLLDRMRQRLTAAGWALCGDEPMKLTLQPKARGYTGTELSDILKKSRIYVEFADADYLVMMPAPCQSEAELKHVCDVLCVLPKREPITECPPPIAQPVFGCTPRQAMLAPHETLPPAQCVGRICAETALSCPPAVPVIICGEVLTMQAVNALHYYNVNECSVVVR